jgi:hypothetical protein
MASVIFTNKALAKMAGFGLSEGQVMDAYNKGTPEKWTNGAGYNSVRKYNGYEIGVAYFVDSKGITRITSVWTRENRR